MTTTETQSKGIGEPRRPDSKMQPRENDELDNAIRDRNEKARRLNMDSE